MDATRRGYAPRRVGTIARKPRNGESRADEHHTRDAQRRVRMGGAIRWLPAWSAFVNVR